jgi:ring-1,2-phenylacetyl-CoA epoxidase subunit PaaC
MQDQLYKYLLMLGDNSMILGHRLSELCGHGPSLETDIALTNISLDLFGQVRSYFQYAAKIKAGESTEDDIAYLRTDREYLNCILVEQSNEDFAHVIVRQFLFDVYHKLLLDSLIKSKDEQIAAIATKSLKEVKYHLRFSSEWMKRLGGGTKVSHDKMQVALNALYPYAHELYNPTGIEEKMYQEGIGADLKAMKVNYLAMVKDVVDASNLELPATERYAKGKEGMHSELMGYLLAEFQYMQRTYPKMSW